MSTKRKKPSGRHKPIRYECNGCGGCCDPVTLAIGPEALAEFPVLGVGMEPRQREWIENELTECDPPPWIPAGAEPFVVLELGGRKVQLPAKFYSCANYDAEARLCLRYDERPEVCRDFPWYGGEPDERAALPPACEFVKQVGREPVSVEIMRKPRP